MNIQIFGTKKSSDARKAERWFKERRVRAQFIDLNEKGISRGELRSAARAAGGFLRPGGPARLGRAGRFDRNGPGRLRFRRGCARRLLRGRLCRLPPARLSRAGSALRRTGLGCGRYGGVLRDAQQRCGAHAGVALAGGLPGRARGAGRFLRRPLRALAAGGIASGRAAPGGVSILFRHE